MKGLGAVNKWKRGERLTRGEAILAQCHECNDGHLGDNKDCKGLSCPLYQYMPYRSNSRLKVPLLRAEKTKNWQKYLLATASERQNG